MHNILVNLIFLNTRFLRTYAIVIYVIVIYNVHFLLEASKLYYNSITIHINDFPIESIQYISASSFDLIIIAVCHLSSIL